MRLFSLLFKKAGMTVPSILCETMRMILPSPSVCECKLTVLPLCENRRVKAGVRECVYSPFRVSVSEIERALESVSERVRASL